MRRGVNLAVAGMAVMLILASGIYFVGVAGRALYKARYIGNYPPLKAVERGMSKADIAEILGQPTTIKANDAVPEGQSEHGARIKEAWIYEPFGWNGSIEIDFDAEGKCIGVSSGHC